MAVDTKTPLSPGWWIDLLAKQLAAKQPRLKLLDDYWAGRPPLVHATQNQQSVFYKFQRVARTNFAELVVQARRERLAVRAIRTKVGANPNGDDAAYQMYSASSMDLRMSDLSRYVGVFGEGYLANALTPAGARITAEDPRQMIAYEDPLTGEPLAALKLFHDFLTDRDYACLWLPGEKHVAVKTRRVAEKPQMFGQGPPPPARVTWSPSSFDLLPVHDPEDPTQDPDAVYSETYALTDLPVTRILGRDGLGLFELHTDVLDRINHTILQQVVIATMQAFKQRGIKLTEDLPDTDEQGQKIDYDDIFSADPGALWKLPPGTDIWESDATDMQGILASVKDGILHMAATTKTPLSMFTPDAATQSAEGASLQREGLVFSVEDMQRLIGRGLARAISIGFKLQDDANRAELARIAVEWLPAERYSLAERASADAQGVSLTWEQKQRMIWQQTPSEIAQAQTQRAQDAFMAAAVVQAKAGGTGATA